MSGPFLVDPKLTLPGVSKMNAQDYLKLLDFLIPLVDKYGTKEVKSQVTKILATMKKAKR